MNDEKVQIDELAQALHDFDPWLYGHRWDGEDIYKPWAEAPDSVQGHYRRSAEVAYRIVAPERDRYREALEYIADRLEYQGTDDVIAAAVREALDGKKRGA